MYKNLDGTDYSILDGAIEHSGFVNNLIFAIKKRPSQKEGLFYTSLKLKLHREQQHPEELFLR